MRTEALRLYPFKPAARQLSTAEFRGLTQNGVARHVFSNGRELTFVLSRGNNFDGQPSAHLDAFDSKNYAGRFGMSVVSADHHLAEEDSQDSFSSPLPFDLQPFPTEWGNLYVAQDYRSPKDRDPQARCVRESDLRPQWLEREDELFDPSWFSPRSHPDILKFNQDLTEEQIREIGGEDLVAAWRAGLTLRPWLEGRFHGVADILVTTVVKVAVEVYDATGLVILPSDFSLLDFFCNRYGAKSFVTPKIETDRSFIEPSLSMEERSAFGGQFQRGDLVTTKLIISPYDEARIRPAAAAYCEMFPEYQVIR